MTKSYLSFRLRTLFMALSAVSLVLGVVSHRVREQRIAVKELRLHGNNVTYDFEAAGLIDRLTGRGLSGYVPPGPSYLSKWLGIDACHNAVAVTLSGEDLEATIRQLQRLPQLKTVYRYGSSCGMGLGEEIAEDQRLREALPGVTIQRVTLAIVG